MSTDFHQGGTYLLWRSDSGLLMGKFRQFLTEYSVRCTATYSFQDNSLSKSQRIFTHSVFAKSFQQMQDSCQTETFGRTKQNSAGQEACLLSNYHLFLPETTGHLSDKLKFSAGQNENLLVLSDSPAVFANTAHFVFPLIF